MGDVSAGSALNYLPAGGPMAQEVSGHAARRRPVLLVVDGHEPLREALRLIFEYDYEVLSASSGPRALSLIQRDRVDVAIVDLRLPGMSGAEFIAQSRSLDPDIPMVVLSDTGAFESAREAMRVGAFDLHPKPFDLRALRAAVQQGARRREWLRKERQTEAARRAVEGGARGALLEKDLAVGTLRDLSRTLEAVTTAVSGLEREISRATAPAPGVVGAWRKQLEDVAGHLAGARDLALRGGSRCLPAPASGTCDPGLVLEDLGRLLRASPVAERRRVDVRAPAEATRVALPEVELLRALAHLAFNALEASAPADVVQVEAWVVNQPLDVDHFGEEPYWRWWRSPSFQNSPPLLAIAVRDGGAGVAPAVWAEFGRFSPSSPASAQRPGVGWRTVRDCLESCGGAWEARTSAGHGSCFTVYLPIADLGL